MSHCVPEPSDSFQSPRRAAPSLSDRDGRNGADAVAAFLHGWFGELVSVRTLRTIAEAMVENMLDNHFVIMPCDGIVPWADHFRQSGV